jgi:hypothetical protein
VCAQFWRVFVPVDGYCVLHGGFQQLMLVVGEDRHRAISFAGKISTVYELPDHGSSILLFRVSPEEYIGKTGPHMNDTGPVIKDNPQDKGVKQGGALL